MADISRVTRISSVRLQAVEEGKAAFSSRQLGALERETGLTAAQLAMSCLEPNKAVAELLDLGAKLNRNVKKPTRRPKRAVT